MKGKLRDLGINKKKFPTRAVLYVLPVLLSLVGLIFVFESSSIRALSETGDSFYYLKLQIRWILLGIGAMITFSLFPYKKWYYLSFPFMAVIIFLLVLVLIPSIGNTVNGARRWIDLGFFSIQPTEFAKLGTILYLSSWFSTKEKKKFLPFITLISGMMLLILLQPDMGTAIIIFLLSVTLYYLAGRDLHYLFILLPTALVGGLLLILVAPYRMRRFTAFLDPHSDPMGIGYHINQVMISLSNGGLFGSGFGASRQKYLFLPEAHTDSIFAIYGEEFGFIGGLFLIVVYLYFLYKLYHVYQGTSDTFGKLLAGGIFAFFGFQIITNLAGMTALMPMTGVPLPFISYGGSHILISFMLLGIAANIAKHAKV
jgi:cell division protein FtsW